MGSQESVQFPKQISLILDCLPYAVRTFGVQANLSSIQWFRNATKHPHMIGAEEEIVNNMTNIFLVENRERLFIKELTTATGAQVGTEAAYKCSVCRNVVPLEPLLCSETTTVINVEGEWPHLTCMQYCTVLCSCQSYSIPVMQYTPPRRVALTLYLHELSVCLQYKQSSLYIILSQHVQQLFS